MRIAQDFKTVGADEFARRFPLRASNLMWLLGAGASASAGIPTAWDMIWDFKQQLFVSQRGASLKSVADLSNPAIRNQLQSYINSSARLPAAGAPDEYAALFEAAWPDERDRRTYVDGELSGSKPSYGHIAMATLMKAGLLRIVWTTNFDPLIADAAAKVFDGTGALTTAALDSPDLAAQALSTQRWPIEIKLHGDFRSRRLKNTADELRQQDARLRQELKDASRANGLIVVGYSGRDESIMQALMQSLDDPKAFPAGFFWLHRGEDPPLPAVTDLLSKAAAKGIDGGLVVITNFDEALRDLIRQCPQLDTTVLDAFAATRRRWTPPARPTGQRGWPVLRLNALPLLDFPTHCRRIECSVGGYADTRAAIESAGAKALVARARAGVLAFGTDAELKSAFDRFGIKAFDLHAIEAKRLRYESADRGLLRAALSTALARENALDLQRHRNIDLLTPSNPNDARWQDLKKLVQDISGSVNGDPTLKWKEGISVRLDWADDRPWLLFEPRTVFTGRTQENRALSTDLGRERTVRRYNKQLNDLIAFWADCLSQGGAELRALGIADGVDAVFHLAPDTAFSRRVSA